MADSDPKKIGFLIPEFPGQTHSFFWREMRIIERDFGFETEILSTRLPPQAVEHEWLKETDPYYLYPLSLKDCAALLLSAFMRIPRFLRHSDSWPILRKPKAWGLLAMATKLGWQCRALGVDHLHIHSCANSAILGAMCSRMYGLPYSVVLHGPFSDYGEDQSYKWRHAAFVFVITDLLYQEALIRMPDLADKIYIAPMGVDTDQFTPVEDNRQKDFDGFTWFCCARLNEVKGFDTLIPAVANIAKEHPDLKFRLIIAGEDEFGGSGYRQTVEKEIARHGLDEDVSLLGAVKQETVLHHLQNSDGFVLASKHEPLGVVYMEAMSCGLPTIGTDAGGVAELIENNKDGLLVPANDPVALADAMHRVMTTPELGATLGKNGRETIQHRFASTRSAKLLADLVSNY